MTVVTTSRVSRVVSALLLSASLGAIAPAYAQSAPAASGEAAGSGGLAEIVVTAQRRSENLQSVAVAATALSGDALTQKGVSRLDQLQTIAPSLSITDAGLTQNVNIRGIGLASGSPSAANGVATYIDGVFQPPIVSTNSFYDIGSVEVFRGPQGTFVGSNSTGGAIFINSRSPDLHGISGYGEVSGGNYAAFGAEGAVNLPLSSTLAVRVAGKYRKHDSYYTDIGPYHNQAGRLDETAGRLGVLWKPSDPFQALLKVEFATKGTGGYPYRPFAGTAYAPYRPADIRTLDYDSPTRNDERALQATLELKYELAGGTVLRSISGYQNKRVFNLYDTDGTDSALYPFIDPTRPALGRTLPVTTNDQFVRERVWTQEINVISPKDQPLSWIFGGYFQRNRIDVNILALSNGFPTDITPNNRKTTTGVFGQMTWKMTPKLALDVGARYSHYSVSGGGAVIIGRGIPGFPPTGIPVASLDGAHSDGRMTGKVSLNWTPDSNNLLYAFVARGYKPGGFNSATSQFGPETVMDYELGWKSTLAGGLLRTQLGAFYYDYKDFQFDILSTATGQIAPVNLANAKVKGIEAQLQAKAGGFTFDGGVAYVDSSIAAVNFVDYRAVARDFPGVTLTAQCPAGQPSNPGVCMNYTPYLRSTNGGPNLFSPKWTYNLGLRYDLNLGDVRITPSVNYAYVGPQYSFIGYSPISDLLPGRGMLSARLGIEYGKVMIEAYGTNLANKAYVTGQNGNNEYFNAPREYGVRLRYDF